MDNGFLILFTLSASAASLVLAENDSRYERIFVWLHPASGGLAIYSIEAASCTQPFFFTAIAALMLCLIPTISDELATVIKTYRKKR